MKRLLSCSDSLIIREPYPMPRARGRLRRVRNRFDQLGKQIGQEALGASGPTVAHDEISPDAQHADLRHEPDPAREAERARLGLLGRLAAVLCLIEIFGHAPDEDEVLACLGKLIAFRQKRAQSARRKKQARSDIKPFLWIIAAGRPASVLAELGACSVAGWPQGVYFSPGLFRVGIVVASELPRERSTLLLRLMAAGPLLPQAIKELSMLPADAYERAVAEQILLRLQHVLERKPNQTPEEQEFVVTMYNTWEKARELGLKEGRQEGRKEGELNVLLRQLRARFGELPAAALARIQAADTAEVEQWSDRVLSAKTLAEVLGEPS
jgi:hypothetical protein